MDPENNTAVCSAVVDGSEGVAGYPNASTNVMTVLSTANLNFYTGLRSYIMQVACHDPNNATLKDSGTVAVRVLEAPAPPVITAAQILAIPWAGTVGALSPTPVSATLPAAQYNGTFTSPLTYLLVPYGATAFNACAINASSELATTTGALGGTPLFALASTTGVLSVAAVPTVYPAWASRAVFPLGGAFALASYKLCVNVTTRFGKWAAAPVTVALTTSLVGTGPHISGYFAGVGGSLAGAAGLVVDTVAPTAVYFLGAEFGAATANGSAAGLTANYTNGVNSTRRRAARC